MQLSPTADLSGQYKVGGHGVFLFDAGGHTFAIVHGIGGVAGDEQKYPPGHVLYDVMFVWERNLLYVSFGHLVALIEPSEQ